MDIYGNDPKEWPKLYDLFHVVNRVLTKYGLNSLTYKRSPVGEINVFKRGKWVGFITLGPAGPEFEEI